MSFTGYATTRFGPITHSRAGMLTWCNSSEWVQYAAPGAVVLCSHDVHKALEDVGAYPVTIDGVPPARAFWNTVYAAVDKYGETYSRTRPFQTHDLGLGPQLMPAMGGARIWPDASVSATASVDPGVYGEDTEIRANAHVDNNVHVAHSVVIGEDAHVVANSAIGGWCEIGAGAYLGIGVTVRNRVKVGAHAHVGMGSNVVADVPPGAKVMGNPARIYGWAEGHEPEEG